LWAPRFGRLTSLFEIMPQRIVIAGRVSQPCPVNNLRETAESQREANGQSE
jgi:hypothetical protein